MSGTTYNKVTVDGVTLLDLSQDTVSSASHIRQGYVGHLNDGTQVTGIYEGSGGSGGYVTQDQEGYIVLPATGGGSGGGGGSGTYQAKTNINPTTSSQTITPDSGYDALSSVQINAMPSGSATAPASISGSSATVSTGTNTLTLSKTVSVTPSVSAGYVASGTAGNSSVSLTASVTTKAAATYHPSASDQTISASQYLTGAQTIKGVSITNLSAANVKSGVTIKVGDSTDDDCVTSVTGTYTGSGGGTGATQHTIHLEFSDSTDTDINVYYDDALIGTMITSYTPATYNNKTVDSAALDNVIWYEPSAIPIGVELIDYTKVTRDYVVDSDGVVRAEQWYSVSDYTPIDPNFTYSYTGIYWFYLGFYDSSKYAISGIHIYNDGTQDANDSNIGHGTLSGNKIPSNAAYVRITGGYNASSSNLSLIRTA